MSIFDIFKKKSKKNEAQPEKVVKKTIEDEIDEKAREAKARADAYVYSPKQLERLELLERIVKASASDRSIDNMPEDLRAAVISDYVGNVIGIFDDEILPSKTLLEKYHMIPTPHSEFSQFFALKTISYSTTKQRDVPVSLHLVDAPKKSVVGGAVKGAIIGGAAGAVVGAIATANKNNHPSKQVISSGGHTVTTEKKHYRPGLSGYRVNPETNRGEVFEYKFHFPKLWIHSKLLQQEIIQKGQYFLDERNSSISQMSWVMEKGRNRMYKLSYIDNLQLATNEYEGEAYQQKEIKNFGYDLLYYGKLCNMEIPVRDGSKVICKGRPAKINITFDIPKYGKGDKNDLVAYIIYEDNEREEFYRAFMYSSPTIPLTQVVQKMIDSGELEIVEY